MSNDRENSDLSVIRVPFFRVNQWVFRAKMSCVKNPQK